MNMKTRILLTIAATSTILAGCSNEETNEVIDSWDGEIRLSSGLAVQTRTYTPTQGTQIKEGQEVYVWADKATTPAASYISAWKLTAGSSGSLADSSDPKYYPTDGNKLDFYAMHGNFGSTPFTGSTDFPSSGGITHTVEADQSGTEMTNYAKSDLLYAITKDVQKSNNAVSLTFYHMLSKVEIALLAGDGNPTLTDATVTILNTKLKATFTPTKTVTMSTQSDRAGLVTVPSDNNDAAPITVATKIATNDFTDAEYGEAIVVPQEVSAKADFIKVALANGGATFTYKIPDSGALTLASGKVYKYNITVKSSGLSVASSITDWDATAGTSTGNATMDDPTTGEGGAGGA